MKEKQTRTRLSLHPRELFLWLFSVTAVTLAFFLSQERAALTFAATLVGVTALLFVAKGEPLWQVLTVVFAVSYSIASYRFAYYGEMITYLGMTAPIAVLAALVTGGFYFVLRALGTTNLALSTVSVTTSFFATALTFLRSPLYGLAYGANDLVLVGLWTMAAVNTPSEWTMVVCFLIFFLNDAYGFFDWRKMKKKQSEGTPPASEAG